jgi:hypothetical protein
MHVLIWLLLLLPPPPLLLLLLLLQACCVSCSCWPATPGLLRHCWSTRQATWGQPHAVRCR